MTSLPPGFLDRLPEVRLNRMLYFLILSPEDADEPSIVRTEREKMAKTIAIAVGRQKGVSESELNDFTKDLIAFVSAQKQAEEAQSITPLWNR